MIYISYYTDSQDVRISSPAANAKTLSISRALQKNGYRIKIYSTCTTATKGGWISKRNFDLDVGIACRQIGFFSSKIGLARRLQYYWANVRTFFTLLCNVKKGEDVLFYHAIERSYPVLLAKKIKKFRLILEVEEIYANARKLTKKEIREEQREFQAADAFIFPTERLNELVNKTGRPYAIIHGTYEVEPVLNSPAEDGILHVVYAGTLDPVKGGAYIATEIATFLDEGYHIHILGFGEACLVEEIRKKISWIQQETKCQISYDGCLLGDEYKHFLQACHVGLSTQNPEQNFNDSSFPSKILSYMANGLDVVSVRIPVVESSAVDGYVHYANEYSPRAFADAIRQIKLNDKNSGREWIQRLNLEFTKDVTKVLQTKERQN